MAIPYFSHLGWKVTDVQSEGDITHGCDLLLVSSVLSEPVLAGAHIAEGVDISNRLDVLREIKLYADSALTYRYGADGRGRLYKYYWITTGVISSPTGEAAIRDELDSSSGVGRVEVWDLDTFYDRLGKTDILQRLESPGPADGRTSSSRESRPLKVFVSYAQEDKTQVGDFCRRLKEDGFDLWLDKEKLLPGQDWKFEIPQAMLSCDAIIVCLSKTAVRKKGYFQKELEQAIGLLEEQPEGDIYLVPVKLEEVESPAKLCNLHWASLYEKDGYESVVRALKKCEGELQKA
ncbi:MAG: toll/interleukin-1 receptor domain-containing protein, partial [Acidobacteria bacterium]|nr:toll/interleukin-1 receptor domain-containing protein [Acidobacteriota bacterium]